MFGEDSEFTADCEDQFLKVTHKVIENDLQSFLLEKINNENENGESDFQQIDWNEFGFAIDDILLEDVYEINHIKFNIIVYYAINQILDLSKNPKYWSEMNREVFLLNYEKEYNKLKRGPVIDNILS
ncbi:MAG: hypothetical protein V4670_02865 [Bacteroidota bacterium]